MDCEVGFTTTETGSTQCTSVCESDEYYDETYTLQEDILTADECVPILPAPRTDNNVEAILYVFTAILLIAGLGLTYSESKMRKEY